MKTVRTIYKQEILWQACAQYTMICSLVRVFAASTQKKGYLHPMAHVRLKELLYAVKEGHQLAV